MVKSDSRAAEKAKEPEQAGAIARSRGDGKAADEMPSGKVVGAVVGAVKILRYLASVGELVGVSRIAKETGLNTSTTFNILRTLALHDLVNFDPLTKTYSLSLGIMEIAKGATAFGGDIGMIRPMMERVATEYGVTVTLWQPVGKDRKVLIMSAQPRNAMQIQMAVGQRLPLLIGSTGRVFAAFGKLSMGELQDQFRAIRWQKPITFKDFMDQVAETRERGWAMDDGNFAAGTVLISTPILDQDGNSALAVTANMFEGQYDPDRAVDIVDALKSFSAQASRVVPL